MVPRIIGFFNGLLSDPHVQRPVHFHTGPDSQPAVCLNERCEAPSLDL